MKHGKMLRRLTAMALSAAMAASSAFAVVGTNSKIELDKTATTLSADDQTKVTLSLGSTSETTESDIVFVLDKSASTDIRQEAMNMLDELQRHAEEGGHIINVGVVNFEQGILDELTLTSLATGYDEIKKHVIFHDAESSGTNIHAGLARGLEILNSGSADPANKHLVLVTDGVGYLWGDNETPYSIYSENVSNGEENLYASHETIDWHNQSDSYYAEFANMRNWVGTYAGRIEHTINTYGIKYDEGQYKAKDYGVEHNKGQDTDWSVIKKFAPLNSYVPVEQLAETASAADCAIYKVAEIWEEISSQYNGYSYADPRYYKDGKYAWAYNAIANLGDIGDYSADIPSSASEYEGMFDAVQSTVLYEISSGTITDIIGEDFDLVSLGSVRLKVGGQEIQEYVDDEKNIVYFGGEDQRDYVLTYTKDDDGTETLVFEINVPVAEGKGIELSYDLVLVNKSAVAGDHTAPTNVSAILEYESTVSGGGKETFPVPKVNYSVSEPVDPPHGGDDDDKPSGGGDNDDRYEGADLTVVKVDEDGETIEANARFRIYKEQGKKTMWYKGNQSWSEDEEDAWIFNTSVGDGSFTAYDLKPGTYYIVEVSAPEGYDLAEEPLEVEVESRDVTVEFVNSGDGVVTTPTKPVPDTGR